MRDLILSAIGEQERAYLCIWGVIGSCGVELEEVEHGQGAEEKKWPPEVATVVCKLRREKEAKDSSVA
jgi:hypothetical protein